jgi:glycosyltransferase involved in cell wall biosynthesis
MTDGAFGGVQQVVIGLASALAELNDGDETYYFLVHGDAHEWLLPYLNDRCELLLGPPAPPRPPAWRRRLASLPGLRTAYEKFAPVPPPARLAPPKSNGLIERAGVDVMHFTIQGGFLTDVPSIYQPHDLQHVHLPQYFSRGARILRDARYRALCDQAKLVVAMSRWGRQDLIDHFALPAEKVCAIPWAPILSAYPTPTPQDVEASRLKFDLPDAFVFYPGKTYPHKNHIGLIDAIALLRDRHGLTVPLVCSGGLSEFYPAIRRRVRQRGLDEQVRFLGFVTPLELQCLYRLSRCMAFPTEFEGWGLPLLEAFIAGVPTACSNVTCLPGQAGDAALLFDPNDVSEMADAVKRLWSDADLRRRLANRGRARAAEFSWEKTARIFRAYYRSIGDRPLTAEDQRLIAEPPPV